MALEQALQRHRIVVVPHHGQHDHDRNSVKIILNLVFGIKFAASSFGCRVTRQQRCAEYMKSVPQDAPARVQEDDKRQCEILITTSVFLPSALQFSELKAVTY